MPHACPFVCDYLLRSGRVCGRPSYLAAGCYEHRGKARATMCGRGCGRATASFTGYCGHCGGYQTNAIIKNSKRRRAMNDLAAWLVENWTPTEPTPDPAGDAVAPRE